MNDVLTYLHCIGDENTPCCKHDGKSKKMDFIFGNNPMTPLYGFI